MSTVPDPTYLRPVSDDVVGGRRQEAAMKSDAPLSLVAAGYRTRGSALQDFTTLWGSRFEGDFHHTSVAVLGRDPRGELRVERHNSTAKHLAWGGALLGGALVVVAPTTGVGMLAAVGMTGAGEIIDHLRHHGDQRELSGIADLLDGSAWGLVAVVVNRRGKVVAPLLARADTRTSIDMPWGDLQEELCHDFSTPLSGELLVAM
jgi:hypothetical protein